jgi:hypothetical protein
MKAVKLNINTGYGFPDDGDSWALLQAPDKNNAINGIIAGPMYCREELMADITGALGYSSDREKASNALKGKQGWSYFLVSIAVYSDELVSTKEKFAIDKKYQDVYSDAYAKAMDDLKEKACVEEHKHYQSRIKAGVDLLNTFEKTMGWEKSEIDRGPLYSKNAESDYWFESASWLLKINSKWLISTYTMSMCILIVRAGLYFSEQTIKDYIAGKPWHIHKIEGGPKTGELPYDLTEHVKGSARYWKLVLKNYDVLFQPEKDDPLKLWQGISYDEGIQALVDGNIDDFQLADKMHILIRKGKITAKELKEINEQEREKNWEEDW